MLRPLVDRVVIKRDDEDQKTEGGLWLPEDARDQKGVGTVVAVGPGRVLQDGSRLAMEVKVGDRVNFPAGNGMDIKDDDGKEYLVIAEGHIICVRTPSEDRELAAAFAEGAVQL